MTAMSYANQTTERGCAVPGAVLDVADQDSREVIWKISLGTETGKPHG